MKNQVLRGLLMCILLSSCAAYQPQLIEVPLISEEKEVKINAGISMYGASASVSYGLTNNLAAQIGGNIGNETRYGQIALGLYKKWNKNKVVELYGGFGRGYGEASYGATDRLSNNYQLYFIQPNIGIISSKNPSFEYGFGIKTGYLRSDLVNNGYFRDYSVPIDPSVKPETTKLLNHSLLIEPMAVVRIGNKNWKVSLNFSTALIHQFSNQNKRIPYNEYNLGLGVSHKI